MRVALVIDHLDAGRGGGEGYAVGLARGLHARGHEVHVFAHSWKGDLSGLRTHSVPMLPYPRGAKVLTFSMAAGAMLSKEHFDVVQGFGATWRVDVHRPGGGAERAWLLREIESHPSGWRRFLAGLRLRVSWKLAANLWIEASLYGNGRLPLIVANSGMVARDLLRWYPALDPARIRVIPNGVDLDRFHPRNRQLWGMEARRELGISKDQVAIGFLAHNFRLKGLGCLFSALEGPMPRHLLLLVAGRGHSQPYLGRARRLGVPVRFLGTVQRTERFLAAVDLLVHPTFYDPCANVCLEAMASGLPVVTTLSNGVSELLQDGVSGYVVPEPWETSLLRDRILALRDKELRERMGQAAREAVEHLSLDWHIDQVEALYREASRLRLVDR